MGHIGPILGPSWAFLGLSWPSLRKICQGKFCVTQNLLGQILRNAKFAKANFAYGPSWATLGPSWNDLGAILRPFGRSLGLSWAILSPSCAVPGPLYLYFPCCRSQSRFLNLCFVDAKCLFSESADLGCFQSYCWSILGAILGYLGPSCSHRGLSSAHLVPSCGHLGGVYANLLGQILRIAKFARANFA